MAIHSLDQAWDRIRRELKRLEALDLDKLPARDRENHKTMIPWYRKILKAVESGDQTRISNAVTNRFAEKVWKRQCTIFSSDDVYAILFQLLYSVVEPKE